MVLGRVAGLAAMLAALALPAGPAAADQAPSVQIGIAPDPAVGHGRLGNGLRYAVMRNAAPAGAVSIRLAFDVGSYDEGDQELGYAHFIEHLAFRSTRYAPGGVLANSFAGLGVAFGRDQNAFTTLEATLYRIDLPSNDPAGIASVLGWMRGAADGILFTPEAVDLERGVVIAENKSRASPASDVQRQVARFQAPGLRSSDREPGGTDESLRDATPARLQAFYERWYRPENATLVIVGDAPVEQLERAAREAFASWTGKGRPGTRWSPPGRPAERGLEAFTRSGPALPSVMSACRFSEPDSGGAEIERIRRQVHSLLWSNILAKRLAHLTTRPGSPLLSANVSVSRDVPDTLPACLVVLPTDEKWKEALSLGQAELRRFAEAGPTPLEVEEAVEQLRSRFRAQLYQSGTRVTPMVADQIVEAALEGRTFQHPAEAMRTFELTVAGIASEDVKRAFQADWDGNGPLLSATAPAAPAPAELVAAWTANEQAVPLAAYADRGTSEWLYHDFGKPGRVDRRESFADPGFVRLHFANGTILNFKQTKLQQGGAEIRVRFGHGERGLDARSRTPAALVAGLFPLGGLGRMDIEEIGSALTNTTWAFNLEIETSGFVLSSSTMASQVDQQLQLLAAYMTDAAFGRTIEDKLPTAVDLVYRSFRSDPNAVAVDALERALFPDKVSIPPREQVAGYRAADFERMMRPVLARSPVEVTIVGDVDEAAAKRAVAATFGALPERAPLPPPVGEGPFRRFPQRLPPPVTAFHDGPADKASGILLWPLYVADPARRPEEYAIGLVSAIFQTRLLQQVRGTMGKAYSPLVSNVMIDGADDGYVAAVMEATPADLDALVAAARSIAAELAAGRLSQAELDEARTPLVAVRLQAQERNEAWAGILSHSFRHPEAIDELTRYEADMKALTLDDVRRAAKTWLGRDPMIARALPGPPRLAGDGAPGASGSRR
jgi:zinc protease